MNTREGVKRLNDMIVDSQYAQQLGVKVFNKQANSNEIEELKVVADELINIIIGWKSLIS